MMNIKYWYRTLDYYLILPIFVLLTISFILVYSASPAITRRLSLPPDYFIKRHMIYIILSLTVLLALSFIETSIIPYISCIGLIFSIILMTTVIVSGTGIKGAKRWLYVFGISIQPSEFMKPFFSVVIASILTGQIKFKIYISIIVFLLIFIMLLLQPNFSMSLLLTYSWMGQMFVASIPLLYYIYMCGIVTAGITASYFFLPHVKRRIYNFLFFSQHDNFQVAKSLEAFKNGQLTGVGPGEGNVKMLLPDCHTDFIFSVLAEEFGLVMCLVTIVLFSIIAYRLLYIICKENELFNLLAVFGISIQFITQFIINIAVTLSIVPTTGVTLPLLSYGGSSLLSSSIALGIILAYSRNQIRLDCFKISYEKI